jgi:nucleoid-associated protein YgaU
MKKINIILLLAFTAILLQTSAFAQRDFKNLPDAELTKDEAVIRIQEFTLKVNEAQAKLDKLTADVETLKKDLEDAKAKLKNCEENLYMMIGATSADVEKFRETIGKIDGKIRAKQKLTTEQLAAQKDELFTFQNELKEITKSKISLLPEFYDKIIGMARDLKGLFQKVEKYVAEQEKYYTVGTWAKDRDCLWNIAGKLDMYGDPMQWSKIWMDNTDIIRNPDIIHPGQKLKIPKLGPTTSEETKKVREYWRKKRAAQQKAQEEAGVKGE